MLQVSKVAWLALPAEECFEHMALAVLFGGSHLVIVVETWAEQNIL